MALNCASAALAATMGAGLATAPTAAPVDSNRQAAATAALIFFSMRLRGVDTEDLQVEQVAPFAQQRGERWTGQRTAEIIALHLVAAALRQELHLLTRFDAFGDDAHVQIVGQRNHRQRDGRVV